MASTDLTVVADYLASLLTKRGLGEDAYLPLCHPATLLVTSPKLVEVWSRRSDRTRWIIQSFGDALDQGEIANVVYKDLTSELNSRLADAWRVISTDYPYPTLHTFPGKLKKAKPGSPERAFLEAVAPLATSWARFKAEDMIKKRQPKAVEDVKAKYLAPRAG